LGCCRVYLENLDDLLLLASLFVDAEFSPGSIVFGQFIGMSVLVLASLAGALLALNIPPRVASATRNCPTYLGIETVLEIVDGARGKTSLSQQRIHRNQPI